MGAVGAVFSGVACAFRRRRGIMRQCNCRRGRVHAVQPGYDMHAEKPGNDGQ